MKVYLKAVYCADIHQLPSPLTQGLIKLAAQQAHLRCILRLQSQTLHK